MTGHDDPIRACDSACMIANHCRMGGIQCERCGCYFCAGDLDENGLCADCAPEDETEAGE